MTMKMMRTWTPSRPLLVLLLPLVCSLFLLALAPGAEASSSKVKLASLLANDAVLDRYAAAVAATEPLREDRDKVLREHINPVQLWWMKATKGNLAESSVMKQKGTGSDAIRKAYTYHVVQSGRIIKSLGLSVSDFNTITRRLAHDGKLRSKVLKQAYLYRLESRVNERLLSSVPDEDAAEAFVSSSASSSSSSSSNISPSNPRAQANIHSHNQDAEGKAVGVSAAGAGVVGTSASGGGLGSKFGGLFHSTSYAGRKASTAVADAEAVAAAEEESAVPVATNVMPHRLALFAKSLREIEALRAEHNHMLKQEFKVDALPAGATDPNLFPMLNSKVQTLCMRFPLQAEEIAQKNGFEAEEFNSLLAKARKNPLFRWRVSRMMAGREEE